MVRVAVCKCFLISRQIKAEEVCCLTEAGRVRALPLKYIGQAKNRQEIYKPYLGIGYMKL